MSRKTNEALEEYSARFPALAGLKTDEEFRELAVSAVIEYLQEHKKEGVAPISYIHEQTKAHFGTLMAKISLDFPDTSPGGYNLLEVIKDLHEEQMTTIATLIALSELYHDEQAYSPAAMKAYQDELAGIARIRDAHEDKYAYE